jgi:hypothetical protein
VIAEKTISSFDMFFDQIKQKRKVIHFAEKYAQSPRKTLRETAKNFLKKWG